MLVERTDQLAQLENDQVVTVRGRYVRSAVGPTPPGEPITTARVQLQGGGGVLLGEYMSPHSRRSDEELSRLEGAMVEAVGRYRSTRQWSDPGPMPGLWTGGGPQLVVLDRLALLRAAEPASLAPGSLPTPPVPVSTRIPAVVPSSRPVEVGRLARRSLAYAHVPALGVFPAVGSLLAATSVFLVSPGLDVDFRFALSAITLLASFLAFEWIAVAWASASALAHLRATPWRLELAAYLDLLDDPRASVVVEIEVRTRRPVDDGARRLPLPPDSTVSWSAADRVQFRSTPLRGDEPGHPRFGTRPNNHRIHRYLRRMEQTCLQPLHRTHGIAEVRVRTTA